MIQFHFSEDETVLIKIAGDNFVELMGLIKGANGKFEHNKRTSMGDIVDKVWEVDPYVAYDLAKRLSQVEPVAIPNWIKPVDASDDREFVKYRACIEDKCVASSWKYDFQRDGIKRGISQNRLALFWEMGSGKTYAIQTILNHLVDRKDVDCYVVLSPPEGVLNLAYEFLRFNTFGLTKDQIYICSTLKRNPFSVPGIKVVIMTYRNLIMLHDDFRKASGKIGSSSRVAKNYIPFDKLGNKLALVCDESQYVKSPSSKTFKVLDKAKVFFEYRYLMSGTPSPKYAADLWAPFHLLLPKSVPGDYNTFLKTVASVGNRFSDYAVNYYYEDKTEDFLKSVDYLVSRVSGQLDLPPLTINPIRCQLSSKQKQIYQLVVDSVLTTIKAENDGRVVPSLVRNKFMHLSLALHDPGLLLQGNLDLERTSPALVALLKSWKFTDNGKLEVADSLIYKHIEELGEKAILWSGHPYVINQLGAHYEKYTPYILHGETEKLKGESTADRNFRIVEAFKSDKKSNLLIANYSVLKTSVNITEVTYNAYWDRNWEADAFSQSLKRTHRIGQDKPVLVNPLLFAGSLEEHQNEEIEGRMSFNDRIWTKDSLDLADCKSVFTGGLLSD